MKNAENSSDFAFLVISGPPNRQVDVRLFAQGIQPNPKSEVQISIENVIRGQVKEASLVAIQLPRWPPFSLDLTRK